MNEHLQFTLNKIQTSNYQVKVHILRKCAENHDSNDIKDLGISTLYKKAHSWFSVKPKFDFFLRATF